MVSHRDHTMLFYKDVSFVSDTIVSHLPSKRRRSATGYLNFNCPMCHLVGNHKPDTKMRCGLMITPNSIQVTCFNCGIKPGFTLGWTFSANFKDFLAAIGVDDMQIKRMNHTAYTLKEFYAAAGVQLENAPTFTPSFPSVDLPMGAKSFNALADENCADPDFLDTVQYAFERGEDLFNSTTFFWSPDRKYNFNRRLIIPFYHEGKIVGYTGRIIDKNTSHRRYQTHTPSNYLFNNHVLKYKDRSFICVQEGPTDALAIDGVATLGAKLNDQQAQWLKSYGKQIIVVPDRDESGDRLIDVALHHKWLVAFPKDYWDNDVKDTAEAVKRYGRLYTLTSILKTATDKVAKISILRKLNKSS